MTKRWWISLIAAAAVTGITTGCQQESKRPRASIACTARTFARMTSRVRSIT